MDCVASMMHKHPGMYDFWSFGMSREVNDENRVRYIYDQMALGAYFRYDETNTEDLKSMKSGLKCREYRKAADEAFVGKPPDIDKASMLYNKSISFAPYPSGEDVDSNDLALSFANRSAMLFAIKKYEECLADINQTMKLNYPDCLIGNIHARKGECYGHMGNLVEALETFKVQHAEYLATPGSHHEKMAIIEDRIRGMTIGEKNCKSGVLTKPLPENVYGSKPKIRAFWDGVVIVPNTESGREMKSTKGFKPGDVLFVEQPYASVLMYEFLSSHCYQCYKRYQALIPCRNCHRVMFCSDDCRELSWEKYHSIECPILGILYDFDCVYLITMAIRMLIIATKSNNGVRGLYNLHLTLEGTVQNERKHISNDYSELYFQPDVISTLSEDIQCRLALYSAQILKCLECHTDLFADDEVEDAKLKYFVGGLILKFVGLASFKTSEIEEYNDPRAGSKMPLTLPVAYGMCNTLNVINHSCIPNVCVYWHGDTAFAAANQPIRPGEPLFINYIGTKVECSTEIRQTVLARYFHLTCRCLACQNSYPEDFDPCNDLWRCLKCRGLLPSAHLGPKVRCANCNKKANLKQLMSMVKPSFGTFLLLIQDTIPNPEGMAKVSSQLVFLDRYIRIPRTVIFRYEDLMRIYTLYAVKSSKVTYKKKL